MAFRKKHASDPVKKTANEGFALSDRSSGGYPEEDPRIPDTTAISPNPPPGVDSDALADMRAYSNLREKRKKAKRKKAITAVVVSLVGLAVLAGGSLWFAASMTAAPTEEHVPQTAFVERGTFLDSVSASGKLRPVSSVSATPEVEGLVGEVFVSEGDTVAAGQELYTIVNDKLDKAISQAQQVINEASNRVEAAKLAVNDAYHAKSSGIAAAEAAAQTASNKSDEEGTGGSKPAPFDAEQADSVIRQAELSLSSAHSSLADAQTAYDDAVATAAKRKVVSPIDGNVVSVAIEPGSALGGTSGSTTAPIQIANLSQMLISVEINEVDILKVKIGQVATVSFSAIPDLELQGKVSHIATINTGGDNGTGGMEMPGTVTYTVSILIEQPDPRLKPGMTGKASIESQRLDDALMVPLSAVMMTSGAKGNILVVANPENPEEYDERMVEILASDGLMAAIKGNVSEADEILLVGESDMMGSAGMGEGRASSSGMVVAG